MADPQFQDTGRLIRLIEPSEITRFHVLGERSSGTNFAKRLLGRNTNLRPTEALGWKHGFPHALAVPSDLLVIGCVRAATNWALSMHAKPWHAAPELQAMEFSDFIRAPWDSRIDRPRYFERAEQNKLVGQPLQLDRHPLTGRKFKNLFDLRTAKLTALLSYLDRECNFMLLRMEDMIADPEQVVRHVTDAIPNAPRDGAFRPVHKRLGAKFKPAIAERPSTPKTMSDRDKDYLKSQVHMTQEAALGYRY